MKSNLIKLSDAAKMLIKERHPDAKVPRDAGFKHYNRDGAYDRLSSRYRKAITRAADSGDLHWKGGNVVDRSEFVAWARSHYRLSFRGEPITDSVLSGASSGNTSMFSGPTLPQGPPIPSRPSLSDTIESAIEAYDAAMALYRDVDMQRHKLQVDANEVESMLNELRQILESATRPKPKELRALIDAAQNRHQAGLTIQIAEFLDQFVQHLSWHARDH